MGLGAAGLAGAAFFGGVFLAGVLGAAEATFIAVPRRKKLKAIEVILFIVGSNKEEIG
jgi:hypothetical protein